MKDFCNFNPLVWDSRLSRYRRNTVLFLNLHTSVTWFWILFDPSILPVQTIKIQKMSHQKKSSKTCRYFSAKGCHANRRKREDMDIWQTLSTSPSRLIPYLVISSVIGWNYLKVLRFSSLASLHNLTKSTLRSKLHITSRSYRYRLSSGTLKEYKINPSF